MNGHFYASRGLILYTLPQPQFYTKKFFFLGGGVSVFFNLFLLIGGNLLGMGLLCRGRAAEDGWGLALRECEAELDGGGRRCLA